MTCDDDNLNASSADKQPDYLQHVMGEYLNASPDMGLVVEGVKLPCQPALRGVCRHGGLDLQPWTRCVPWHLKVHIRTEPFGQPLRSLIKCLRASLADKRLDIEAPFKGKKVVDMRLATRHLPVQLLLHRSSMHTATSYACQNCCYYFICCIQCQDDCKLAPIGRMHWAGTLTTKQRAFCWRWHTSSTCQP